MRKRELSRKARACQETQAAPARAPSRPRGGLHAPARRAVRAVTQSSSSSAATGCLIGESGRGRSSTSHCYPRQYASCLRQGAVCRAARTASQALVDNAHLQQGGGIETVLRTAQPKTAPYARDALPRHSSGGTATTAYSGDMVPGKRRSRCSGAHLREQAARGRGAKAALQLGARDGVQLARRAGARVRPLLPRAKQLLRKGIHAVCVWRDAAASWAPLAPAEMI